MSCPISICAASSSVRGVWSFPADPLLPFPQGGASKYEPAGRSLGISELSRHSSLLLQGRAEEAAVCLESLRTIAGTAMERAPTLGHNTQECVRLYENCLSVLNGQPTDEGYLSEEVRLSKNRIHMPETHLVLAQAAANRKDAEHFRQLLEEAKASGDSLYAARRANELPAEMEQ